MTEHGDAGHDRPPRGYLLRAMLRQLCVVGIMTLLYFVLPIVDRPRGPALVLLVAGLLAFAVVAVWQVRAVLRAPHPVVRGLDALAVTVPLYLLLFAAVYVVMSAQTPAAFTEDLDRLDALYFTVTVFATVGFGDIAPVTQAARAVVLVQMVGNLVVLGLLLRLVTGAVRINRERRTGPDRQQ